MTPRSNCAEFDTLRGRLRDQNGQPRDAIVFSLFGDAYPTTTCARAELEAYDAGGRQLLLNETSLP